MLVVCVLVLSLGLPPVAERGVPAWQARTGWLPISKQIIAEVGHRAEVARGNRDETVVLVYGEPGLFFQLNVDGTQVFEPTADLSFLARPPQDPSIPIFLVTGPHAERTSGFQEDLAQNAAYLERIAGYEYLPSDLVLFDQYDPRSLAKVPGSARTEKVSLYKVVYGRTQE